MLLALFLVLLLWLCLASKEREGLELHIKTDLGNFGNVFSSAKTKVENLVTGIKQVPERFVSSLPFRGHIRRFRRKLTL